MEYRHIQRSFAKFSVRDEFKRPMFEHYVYLLRENEPSLLREEVSSARPRGKSGVISGEHARSEVAEQNRESDQTPWRNYQQSNTKENIETKHFKI